MRDPQTDGAEDAENGQDGLSFAEVLRSCLACAIVAIDGRQMVSAFTPEAERLLRLPASQVLNRSFDVLPSALREIIQETLLAGKPIEGRQIILPDSHDRELPIRISTAIQAAASKTSGVIAVLNDLNCVKTLEQNMRQFDRLASIGTLSASMAHEIKNALVAVKTFVDLLLRENPDADLASIVSKEMRRIDSIVSQMLRFAGPAKPAFVPIHLHGILDHSLRLMQRKFEEKKITLHRSFAATPDLVKGDEYQLEQAFINLFFNALEALGPDGSLSVATDIIPPGSPTPPLPKYPTQPQLRVIVKDTGVGIPAENLGRLFEPFFTTKPSGTGLGLPIARRIIQEHRGVITVESELAKETTFSIVLPLAGKPS